MHNYANVGAWRNRTHIGCLLGAQARVGCLGKRNHSVIG
jgi:hypothetical protein